MKRKSELETQLVRARGTDFAAPRTDVASIGTVVRATDLDTNQPEQFTILGAWDSDPEKGIVSYLSPMAQAVLNRKVGEEVEFEIHEIRHRHRIESVQAFKIV
jgi:transcription elongation GreA/GreB family factor